MVALLNTSILTGTGTFVCTEISKEEAKELLSAGFTSFVGHESAAATIEKVVNIPIPYSRNSFTQEVGDIAVIFKLNGRLPFGVEPSVEEIEAIGYKFLRLEKTTN